MFDDEKEMLAEAKGMEGKGKKEECCLCINVFTKCGKKRPWKKEDKVYKCECEKDKKEECCVCINVFVECEE